MSPPLPPIPDSLAERPHHDGYPIPWVTPWSGEGRLVVRFDPMVSTYAVFTKGRPDRGVPVLGSLHPERQRASVMRHRCGGCAGQLEEVAYVPHHPSLVDTHARYEGEARELILTPPACWDCARWYLAADAARNPHLAEIDKLVEVSEYTPVASPSTAHGDVRFTDQRFDALDTVGDVARLDRVASANGGVVGYVRWYVDAGRHLPILT